MTHLHELIEASEPKNEKWWVRDLHGKTHICAEQPMQPYIEIMTVVDRASYDRMKQIAVEFAKACQAGANRTECKAYECCASCGPIYECEEALSKCRELLGEK